MDNELNTLSLEAQLAQLRAENEALKAKQVHALSIKVSEKGGLSIYGLGRFPVTLYRSQAERLFTPEMVERVNQFIQDNAAKLKVKE